jgi:hypothetical protein
MMAFTAASAFAADVTGTWTGKMAGPNGDGFQITFTFKVDGPKLTGRQGRWRQAFLQHKRQWNDDQT